MCGSGTDKQKAFEITQMIKSLNCRHTRQPAFGGNMVSTKDKTIQKKSSVKQKKPVRRKRRLRAFTWYYSCHVLFICVVELGIS